MKALSRLGNNNHSSSHFSIRREVNQPQASEEQLDQERKLKATLRKKALYLVADMLSVDRVLGWIGSDLSLESVSQEVSSSRGFDRRIVPVWGAAHVCARCV